MMTSTQLAFLFVENHLSMEECIALAKNAEVVVDTVDGPVAVYRDAYGKFSIERAYGDPDEE